MYVRVALLLVPRIDHCPKGCVPFWTSLRSYRLRIDVLFGGPGRKPDFGGIYIVLDYVLSIHLPYFAYVLSWVRTTVEICGFLPVSKAKCRASSLFLGDAGFARRWQSHRCPAVRGAARHGRRCSIPLINRRLPNSRDHRLADRIKVAINIIRNKIMVDINMDKVAHRRLVANPGKGSVPMLHSSLSFPINIPDRRLCHRNNSICLQATGILQDRWVPILLLKVLLLLCNSAWRRLRHHLCPKLLRFHQTKYGYSRCSRCQCWMV